MQHSTSINEWAVPFVAALDPGDYKFTVDVPLHFCYNTLTALPNKLYFSRLDLVPDFFSLKADELDLDTTDEENMIIDLVFELELLYRNMFLSTSKRRPTYKHGIATKADYVGSVLDFLSPSTPYFAKAAFQSYPPFFWDWYDEGHFGTHTAEEFIKSKVEWPTVEEFFYNTVNEMRTTHFRKEFINMTHVLEFPDIEHINPFVFPKSKADSSEENTLESLRIRFHIQPKTSVSFSNAALLTILGFDVEFDSQIGYANKQYTIANNNATYWLTVSATRAPSLANWQVEENKFPSVETKVQLRTSEPFVKQRGSGQVEVYRNVFPLSKTEFQDDSYVRSAVGAIVDYFKNITNVNISFNKATGKIILPTPDDQLHSVQLVFPSKVVALKCGYTTEIVDNTTEQIEITEKTKEEEKLRFDLKAKSLVFDTNIVYVIALDTISLDRMHPLAPGFVASLHPEDSTMKMAVPWLQQPDYFRLAEYQTGANHVQLTFELYTILPNRQHVKLNWKPGATVCGIIRAKM